MSNEIEDVYKNPIWVIKSKKTRLSNDVLVQLHRNIVLTKINNLDFFYKYRFYYSTLLMGVLSASIGIFLYIISSPAVIFFVPLPLSVVVLSVFAQHTVWRYYRRFLEAVVFEAKIENLLGLDEPFVTDNEIPKSPWRARALLRDEVTLLLIPPEGRTSYFTR